MRILIGTIFVTTVFSAAILGKKVENIGPMEIISTAFGQVSGEVTIHDGVVIHTYRGIPYAKPPVGDLRWKAPQPMEPWSGVMPCTQWPDRAPQLPIEGLSRMESLGGMSEDCLYLNLITPARTPKDKLPVMVWLHGGGLTQLSSNSLVYCHTALPSKGVVVVTINSRLGTLGYMAHPALSKESDHGSGFYGTLDMISGLKWVKENIRAFGGDPDNVTIFGQSGGGSKVVSLIASPLASGLFSKAIVQSGARSAMPEGPVLINGNTRLADAEKIGEKIAEKLGIDNNSKNVAAQLRSKDWADIVEAGKGIEELNKLVIDGKVLPTAVYDLFISGKQNKVAIIVGSNQGEDMIQDRDPNLLSLMGSVTSERYAYCFSQLPPLWRDQPCVAFHSLELPYVFGNLEDGFKEKIILFLAPQGGCKPVPPEASEQDVVVSEHMMRLWTHFAKTGNPSVKGLIEWPTYDEKKGRYLNIKYGLEVKDDLNTSYVPPPKRK